MCTSLNRIKMSHSRTNYVCSLWPLGSSILQICYSLRHCKLISAALIVTRRPKLWGCLSGDFLDTPHFKWKHMGKHRSDTKVVTVPPHGFFWINRKYSCKTEFRKQKITGGSGKVKKLQCVFS